ncbi:hypothetical protein HY358_00505 [Candidatus Roizmanbacteria bacterium]|nr:hypothetical protein [Candidatus Roizmanbacteria bacterium]
MNIERGTTTPVEIAYLEAQKTELRNLARANDSRGLKDRIEQVGGDASLVRHEAAARVESYQKGAVQDAVKPLEGAVGAGNEQTIKHKAAVVTTAVKEVIKIYKENRNLRPVAETTAGGQLLNNLLDRIDPDNDITSELGAAYIYKLLDAAMKDRVSDILQGLPRKELNELYNIDPTLYRKIKEAIIETAQNSGYSESRINTFRRERAEDEQGRRERGLEETLEYKWRTALGDYFDKETDGLVIDGLFSVEKFSTLVQQMRTAVAARPENAGKTKEQIDGITADEIETKIVSTFSKLYAKVDLSQESAFWDDITRAGFQESIETVQHTLTSQLALLASQLEQGRGGEFLQNFKAFRRFTVVSDKPKRLSDRDQLVTHHEIKANPGRVETNLSDFLRQVAVMVAHERETREYLYNVKAVFLRGAGKDGFWSQLASYSQKMFMTDVDTMMLLPDSKMFMAALRLYHKYLEEEFAKHNWIHQSTMFSRNMLDVRSRIQNMVEKDLKVMFKRDLEITDAEGRVTGMDIWRVRRALNMGIGLSRGVFLNEPEMAAWAEPQLDEKGEATYQSYYTNDATALETLNPQHFFFRWQVEGTMPLLLFLPVEGVKGDFWKQWDHKQIWEHAKEYREAFLRGDQHFTHRKKGERLFIDILPNFGKVGGFLQRAGWRFPPAYEGWLTHKIGPDGHITTKLDHLASFKAIENIGFDIMLHYVQNKLFDGNKLDMPSAERTAFLSYLYSKYVNPGAPADGLQQELNRLKAILTEQMKGKSEEAINAAADKRLVYKALAGAMRNRMPTKMIRIERDRFTQTGTRAWFDLVSHLGWQSEEGYRFMDEAMQNIMKVEALLRTETTSAMQDHLNNPANNGELSNFEYNNYIVTREKIERILRDQVDGEQVARALQLYDAMRERHLTDAKLNELAAKLENKAKYFPFPLGTEEVETTFLAFRGAGERVMTRALSDTAGVETNMAGPLKEFFSALHPTSLDVEKKDLTKIIEAIEKIKRQMEDMHGQGDAHRLVHHLAAMAISYFKKDTQSRVPGLSALKWGLKHSFAAEFVGGGKEVWEWDVADIDNFISELERRRLLPKEAYELQKGPPAEDKVFDHINTPFGRIDLPFKIKYGEAWRKPDYEYYSGKLRREFGASGANIAYEVISKYLPAAALFILWKFISEAFQESEGKKSER